MRTIAVLALPDTIAFDLSTAVETFGRVVLPSGEPGYQVLVCGAEPVVSAGPMRIATDQGIDAAAEAETIVVPGRNDVTVATSDDVLGVLKSAYVGALGSRRSARALSRSPKPACSTDGAQPRIGSRPTCFVPATPP